MCIEWEAVLTHAVCVCVGLRLVVRMIGMVCRVPRIGV